MNDDLIKLVRELGALCDSVGVRRLKILIRAGRPPRIVGDVLRLTRPVPQRGETPCEEDILSVMAQVGHRITTDQILSELEKRNMLHGESTVKMALARMVKAGRLTQDQHGNPRGYGLPADCDLSPTRNGVH